MSSTARLVAAGALMSVLMLLGFLTSIGYSNLGRWFGERSFPTQTLSAPSACNPSLERCTVKDPQLTVALRLKGEVQPLEAFAVEVNLTGLLAQRAEAVAVRFVMAGMNMGLNRFRLHQQTDGSWQGQAVLPWCTTGRQDWLALIEVETTAMGYEAPFAITVK